jgi:hypothetical protein
LEVGVKFRSDVAGVVTGIRFYKSTINTGTHVGNLWTSNGTLLASATFTVETVGGWQQVNFASPVSINSNTVYVASYHCVNGHYSEDDNFFTSAGVNNPPLHALANGVSGFNGVYSYGANSVFPTNFWESANYWVDVAFGTTNNSPSLVSITVSPTNATITTGGSQQFTANGTYSNSSTQDITSQVTWSSTNTAVATVNAAGLVTGVSPGKTAISATLAGVSGSTPLTVQAGPLSISTASLPNGVVNTPYATSLAASGGTPPYTWSIASGALPTGLALNTISGAITGTPNTTGTFNFTAQVRDVSSPVQTATKPLSITISTMPTLITIWPTNALPVIADDGADNPVELGVKFRSDVAGSIAAIRFYKSAANTGTHIGDLWSSNGTLLATATFAGETASGWQQVNFASPVSITTNTIYVASYHCMTGHYSEDDNYFATNGLNNPPLHALTNGVSGPNGVYNYGAGSVFPTAPYLAANYWVDVVLVINTAPLLPAQTNRTIAELTTLTVTNTATDTSALSYTLMVTNLASNSVVTNAAISTNGIITWTPTEAQGPSTNLFTTVASDGTLSATNSFTVTVNEVNTAPTLPVPTNRVVNELVLMTVTNTATDNDIPPQPLTYTLAVTNLLNNSVVTNTGISTNGIITWTPTEAQGPGTNVFTTVVSDGSLTATNSFTVTVNEVNSAPTLPVQTNRTLVGLQGLTVTNTASDSDIPVNPLGYQLTGSPPGGASIDTNGVIRWTPNVGQVPGVYTFTTVVTDTNVFAINAQDLSATNSFTVTVQAIHNGPGLRNLNNVTNNELVLLTVTNTATDSDIPPLALSYSLSVLTVTNQVGNSAVTNAAISTNGVISWTPTEAQGPGVYVLTTIVSDGSLSATNNFTVTINEVNVAPVLPGQGNLIISGLTAVVVTNTASDSDIPINPLGYQLTAAPGGAGIDTNGVIHWTPNAGQVPGMYTFTTVVTNMNVFAINAQDLSATNSFTVTVQAIHNGPGLGNLSNVTNNELVLLTVTNTATDNDIPPLALSYTLSVLTVTNQMGNSAVTNAVIDTNGVISWTPSEPQGPGVYVFTTIVSDGSLSATNNFTVTVNEVNSAPVLTVQTDQTVDVLTMLAVTNTATDPDIPANNLSYTLLTAPSGATIDTNGVITWTPHSAQGDSTNLFTTVVTDDGLPQSSATNSFLVFVNPTPIIPPPMIESINLSDGMATVTWSSVLHGIYRLQYCENLCGTNWTDVAPDVQAVGPTVTATNAVGSSTQQFYRIFVVPLP